MSLVWNPLAAHRAVLISLCLSLTGTLAWASPYSDAEVRAVETQDEASIRDIRNQELTQLGLTLSRRMPTNRRADLYFRLAKINFEAYQAEFKLEGRAHDKRLERGEKDVTIDRTRSRPFLRQGIKACEEVLGFGIQSPSLDEIYYFLSFNYRELGEQSKSESYSQQLIARFPKSIFTFDAHMQLAESAYLKRDYQRSKTEYEGSLRIAQSQQATPRMKEAIPRIYYKLAWNLYRLRQKDAAISTMKKAVESAETSGEKSLNVREEGLRDLALFMTERGRVEEALTYFEKTAGSKQAYPELLERLGSEFDKSGEKDKATKVYDSLLKTYPQDEAAFRTRVKLMELDLKKNKADQALKRLDGVQIPYESSVTETQLSLNNLKALTRRTGTFHHDQFRKKAKRESLLLADQYYSFFLDRATSGMTTEGIQKERIEIKMYLAEVKRELGQAERASQLFKEVVESKDPRYASQAGGLWTASLSEALHARQGKNGSQSIGNEPSAKELEFVQAADELAQNLQNDPGAREASLRAAQVLAGYVKTREDGLKRARSIVERWPDSPQAVTAARLVLQILSEDVPKDDPRAWTESDELTVLKTEVQSYKSNTKLQTQDRDKGLLAAQIHQLEERMSVGAISGAEASQDHLTAARGYESLAQKSTKVEVAEQAYASAILAYARAQDANGMNRVLQAWLKRYPSSRKIDESLRFAGTQALIRGEFVQSAELFLILGTTRKDASSLITAGRIFEGARESARAREAWKRYLSHFRNGPEAILVHQSLAQLAEAEMRESEAIQFYQGCMKLSLAAKAECGARLGDLYTRTQNAKKATAVFQTVAQIRPELASASPYVGYARYRLAEALEKSRDFLPLQLPEAKLKRALNQRLDFLGPLSRGYLSVVEAPGPWAIAALNRLASWAYQFAQDVDKIAPPSKMSSEQAAKFRANLKSVSEPLRAKSFDAWMQAYKRAVDAEALSPALPGIIDRLSQYRDPKAPARAQGIKGRFRLAGVPADGGKAGRVESLARVRATLSQKPKDQAAWVDYGNLLWGEGKPLLGKIAYDRALSIDSKNAAALNNRGVIVVSGAFEEDWARAAEGAEHFAHAIHADVQFLPAKMNRALLLNYYRIFSKSKPLWEAVLARAPNSDANDGLAIAMMGLGKGNASASLLDQATSQGADSNRFSRLFHLAAHEVAISDQTQGGAQDSGLTSSAARCLAHLDRLELAMLSGFEKDAAENLKRMCERWRGE